MKTLLPVALQESLVDDLVAQGWAICDDFLPPVLTRQLAAECRQRYAQGLLRQATIGRGKAQVVRESLRGDAIQWLEPEQSVITDAYLVAMEGLQLVLNRSLYLGLEDYECHFTCYPPGAFYEKHLDRFRDDDRCELSALFYLNEDWSAATGGALRLHLDEQRSMYVQPVAGRLLLFRSAQLWHEVLPARRERLSLTGWFRRRGAGVF